MAFLQSWTSGDRQTALALCHADLRFNGPMQTRFSAEEHLSALAAVAATVTDLSIIRTIAQGDGVVVIYDLRMSSLATSVAIAELNVLRGGKLIEICAFFDTHLLRNPRVEQPKTLSS